jgi:hypothetical protein
MPLKMSIQGRTTSWPEVLTMFSLIGAAKTRPPTHKAKDRIACARSRHAGRNRLPHLAVDQPRPCPSSHEAYNARTNH